MCSALPAAALGPAWGDEGGSSREASQPLLQSCTTAMIEGTGAPACGPSETAAVPASASTAGVKI